MGSSGCSGTLGLEMKFYEFLLGALAVWRVSHLLTAENGPSQLIVRLRRRAEGSNFWASLLDCFHCLSLWISVPVALLAGSTWEERLLSWPALSAAAILTERAINRVDGRAATAWEEPFGKEGRDELLRANESELYAGDGLSDSRAPDPAPPP